MKTIYLTPSLWACGMWKTTDGRHCAMGEYIRQTDRVCIGRRNYGRVVGLCLKEDGMDPDDIRRFVYAITTLNDRCGAVYGLTPKLVDKMNGFCEEYGAPIRFQYVESPLDIPEDEVPEVPEVDELPLLRTR